MFSQYFVVDILLNVRKEVMKNHRWALLRATWDLTQNQNKT